MKKLSLPEIKERQIKILDEIVAFCEKHNIKYFLSSGTLIGAVRHKGYIPWDDDVDLNMFRADYDFFVNNFNVEGYKACTLSNTKEYNYSFVKVSDESTLLVEDLNMKPSFGVNIDIFPLDNYPDDPKEFKRFFLELYIYRTLLMYKYAKIKNVKSFISKTKVIIGKIITFPFSQRKIVSIIQKKALRYRNVDTARVGCLVFALYGYREVYPKDIFSEVVKLDFEGKKYSAPKGYDALLTIIYGDYMTPPPPDKRVAPHRNSAYLK